MAEPTRVQWTGPATAPAAAPAAVAAAALTEAQSATFVAVSGPAAFGDTDLLDPHRFERRATERRLRDAAVHTAVASSAVCMAASLAALAWAGWVLAAGAWGWIWSMCAMGVLAAWAAVPWLVRRHARLAADTRRLRRGFMLLGLGCMLTLALVPWLPRVDMQPEALWLFTLLAAAVALTGAAALAPLRPVAAVAALLPLSPAMAAASAAQVDPVLASSIVLGGLASSAAAALLATSRHRAWLRATRVLIERDDRIRALEIERDAAIRADHEKSRFLAIASHDLRQPVHALGLFAATLDKRLQGSAEQPLVRNVIRSIDGLDRSFNAMLDISRLDAGMIEPNIQHFPLRDLFRRLHMHFAGQAEVAGLGLRFSPGGKAVSSDPQLLERILGNLVQNAIKYTERGGIVVVARSTQTHINVEIWDTGVGIRAADLPRVFEEFFQAGRGQRARAQGLGMGLAIVKRLARLLGHQLTVVSRPGRGTMFRVGIALGGLPDIQDATAAADTLPMPVLQPRTVLIIDDDEAIREGLCMLLEEWGYQAISAGSILEATRAVALLEVPPDLILSDLHLGDGPDGIAAIEAVRQQCGHDVTAILITGDTSHEEMLRATDSGHPVLFKPVQPRKLYNVLRGLAS